jgi:hypothetical protein
VDEQEQDFACAVVHVLRNRDQARSRGVKGRAWAAQWSSRTQAERMAQLYGELLPASTALAA